MTQARHIVLFQHDCKQCSKVGQMVSQLAIEGLDARALYDPEVVSLLFAAGLSVPAKPALLAVNGDAVELLTGLAMRRRLASVVGIRRARAIAGLLGAEWRARLANAASHQPSRRGVVAGALVGIAGWLTMSGVAAAAPKRSDDRPSIRRADPSDVAAALATVAVRRAIQTWGEADAEAYEATGDGQRVLMLLHPTHNIVTVVDGSASALRARNAVALSIGAMPGSGTRFRYYTVGGYPFADIAVTSHNLAVSEAPRDAFVEGSHPAVEPDYPAHFLCLQACIHKHLTIPCYDTCASCAFQVIINPNWMTAFVCLNCLACGGVNAIKCMLECWFGT